MMIRLSLVVVGVAGLLLRRAYAGPGADLVHSYAGNVSVSFALYFVLAASRIGARWGAPVSAAMALAAVEAFEVTDGFGIMQNVVDPLDLGANLAGVGLAWLADTALVSGRGPLRAG